MLASQQLHQSTNYPDQFIKSTSIYHYFYQFKSSGSTLLSTMSTSNEIYALLRSPEIDNNYDEIQSIIDSNRSVLQSTDGLGDSPLHVACDNSHVTLRVVQLLLNGLPESISQPNQYGNLPIHSLCRNNDLDETVSADILTLLLEASPESVERASDGELPIRDAARAGMPFNFIKILVQAYPESVTIPGVDGMLPIHYACDSVNCRLDSVKYLLDICPESIYIESGSGWLPIHHAASSNGPQKVEHLISKDPTCASMVTNRGQTPLHLTCSFQPNLAAVQLLFDTYPEAIDKANNVGMTALEYARDFTADDEDEEDQRVAVVIFLEAQLVYAEKSQDMNVMTKLDENGQLPLHHALKDNAPLGSIKLLIKGCALAVRVPDHNMAFPLHIACEFSSVKVVQYLMDMLDERMKNHSDANKDSIFHYACRGGNCEVVKYLLDEQSPHITKRNADKKLPIHLMCESEASSDSLEHADTIFRLLLAYPETVREYM